MTGPTDPAPDAAAALRVVGLGHRFAGANWLFDDLGFDVRRGEVVGIVGPSGCGKSTLLSILAGWLAPTRGRVERHGIDHVGWVFQNPHGVARRTTLDHVVLPLIARGQDLRGAREVAAGYLAEFGLAPLAGRLFRELSGGEAQRLMLARAVASEPDLLLVDEPTAQLDRTAADTVNRVLARVAKQNTVVMVATHDPRTQEQCTRVIDLADAGSVPVGWRTP